MVFVTRVSDVSLNGCGSIGPHLSGNPKLIVSGLPACTIGSIGVYSNLLAAACLSPGPYAIISGSPKLTVTGLPIARVLDVDTDAGLVMTGSPKLIVP
jgi:uncharacterized Zn-binding protein involved in type VI secretion